MPRLLKGNEIIENVFGLLGSKEDSLTYSVGYGLANNHPFLSRFLKSFNVDITKVEDEINIHLQKYNRSDGGETDIEIYDYNTFHIIIEAKRGWNFPPKNQLDKYKSRFNNNRKGIKNTFVVLNENNEDYIKANFDESRLDYQLKTYSWKKLIDLTKSCYTEGSNSEKRLIKQLNSYLIKNSTMQKSDSNLVYVVSLGSGHPEGWSISWIDIVKKVNKYFHPVGGGRGGWPKEPPNYIAFRYYGKLQSIHHIDSYESIVKPNLYFKDAPIDYKWDKRHYLYNLGPAIFPSKETKSGKKIVRSNRVWAALDLLLTCQTIEEARDKTKLRLGEE